jgi:hypothetical protein
VAADDALLDRVQVVPISSQVARLYPAEASVTLNGTARKAMADQLTKRQQAPAAATTGHAIGGGRQCRRSRCLCPARHLTVERLPAKAQFCPIV